MVELVVWLALVGTIVAQAARAPLPSTPAEVGAWDAAIVRRAAALIPAPSQWDRASTGDCRPHAASVSLICALQQAADEAGANQPAISDCRFHATSGAWVGSCGPLFDEASIFSVTRARGVTTGVWRKDATPVEVWAGTMADAASPVMYEARQLIGAVTTKKYNARLVDYNNDPETSFADLQKFFRLLEARVAVNGSADLARSTDAVEIEVYDGGSGVIRTYEGWFPISGFAADANDIRFQFDGKHDVPPNALDKAILERASTVITSEAVWNRADNRKCPADATTWSIYCAVERSMIEVTGGFNHRRPAGQLVRRIVEERSAGRNYSHRMMDYNNDPRTVLADVRSLFAEAIARVK
jgi:hypothetical protein